jgi:hypothetical protein
MLDDVIQREFRRIRAGPGRDELPDSTIIDHVKARCEGSAELVLERTREVLEAVLSHMRDAGLTTDGWRSILPDWFVAACAQERSPDAVDPWEVELSRVPREQRFQWVLEHPRHTARELHTDKPWRVSAFVFWFKPENREWWWWDARVEDANALTIHLCVEDDYSYGALVWLLKTAGATRVESAYGHE